MDEQALLAQYIGCFVVRVLGHYPLATVRAFQPIGRGYVLQAQVTVGGQPFQLGREVALDEVCTAAIGPSQLAVLHADLMLREFAGLGLANEAMLYRNPPRAGQ